MRKTRPVKRCSAIISTIDVSNDVVLIFDFYPGQYSTGKTSMIHYLLGSKYHGSRVGPEPTTDR